jgi:hypothetical protein
LDINGENFFGGMITRRGEKRRANGPETRRKRRGAAWKMGVRSKKDE